MTTMRVMFGKVLREIPMAMLLQYEKQAVRNHGQSLHRLNERGGLNSLEILLILQGLGWNEAKLLGDEEDRLIELVATWKAQNEL